MQPKKISRQNQCTALGTAVIASAVIPTFIAQKWFMPVHEEDIVDLDNGDARG